MRGATGAVCRAASWENLPTVERLTSHHRFSPALNINSMCESCGKPKAKRDRAIFMRQQQVFSWRRCGNLF
jgi:hypothetical protein